MNESDTNRPLSPSVEARKEEMLFGLQSELALFHRGRKRKRMVAGSLVAGAAVLLVGLSLLDFGDEETMVQSNDIAEEQIRQDQPLVETPSPYVVTVGNNDKVREKYIVENSETVLALETVDDEELLAMLAASGNPSFLGKINGEVRLIRDSRSAPN